MPARIASFIRNARPNAYCDHCLSTALGIELRTVTRETAMLGREKGFKQSRDVCTYCGTVEPVIMAVASSS
jgi:hypothetical protein